MKETTPDFSGLPSNLRAICEGNRSDLTEQQRTAYRPICEQFAKTGQLVAPNATPSLSPQPSPLSAPVNPPSLLIRGWNFTAAMARWTLAGMPRRSQTEIDERLAICQACPFLKNDHCTKCGCACVEQNRLINKLALATEKCPEGKWS